MCRNIKQLYNFDPVATEEEIQAAALQFVRKVTGFNKPTKANQEAFDHAVEAISLITSNLLNSLETSATPKNREAEAQKLRLRSLKRFAK